MSEAADLPLTVPTGAAWGPGFDAASATDAWIATIPAAERGKSDAYFEGGYWIEAWGALLTVAIAWLLLETRFSAGLRDFAERRARSPGRQTLIYCALFLLALGVLGLPWALYTGFYREHQYGMSNQTLAAFLGERAISHALVIALGSIALTGIYAIMRRVRERWVPRAIAATAVFVFFVNLAYPLFIAPLFNDFRSLPEGPVRESILALARENSIPAEDVYWFDASRQTRRISANVAGIAGTTRIALNDNLLNGTSLPEIRAVMAHEMGHYALNHALWLPLATVLLLGVGYWAVNRLFGAVHARVGARYGVRDIADPAGLPLAMAIFAVVMYLLTPLSNSIVRIAENQADAFGLEAAQEPQGFASVAMRLASYRKIEPGRVEECIFFDHPSGRTRVMRSMRWLAAHPPQAP
ncbi:MAG TPA: M48 family metallopeptidase [Steroidobacteraceae bacterium]|nr:M48 family metallopeptidase [Steroidobacteraceae bacterium]